MILTHNDDYTEIKLKSSNLTDFSGIDTVTLNSTINCGSTVYTDTIESGDVDADGEFTVDLSALYSSTTLEDSVYSFTLIITNSDTTVTTEYACLFVDNDTKCRVAECVKDNQNIELQLDYYILSRAGNCNCQCDNLCTIYNRLKNELNSCQGC